MLVETMSLQEALIEVRSEINTDKPKFLYFPQEYDRERRKKKVKPENPYPKWFDYTSAKKNKWLLCFSKAPSIEKYKYPNDIVVTSLIYHYTKLGLRVYETQMDNGWDIYNGHLFERYNERMNLKLTNPLDKVKRYFERNSWGHFKHDQHSTNAIKKVRDGLVLGTYIGCLQGWPNYKAFEYKTFISPNEMFEDQEEISKHLVDSTGMLIESLLNEENWNKEDYRTACDVFLGMQK